MTKRIFKYPIKLQSREIVMMPSGAEILSVCVQEEIPVLYAMVAEGNAPEPRIIRTVTTGEIFNDEWCYFVGTIQYGAPKWFVAHIFVQLEMGQNDPVSDRFADDRRQVQEELGNAR